jgi:hypothetical protein
MKTMYVICCLVLWVFNGAAVCQPTVGGFTKEVVVTIPWGSEPGEIGLIERALSSIPGGPSSLTVDDKNNIYLLDGGNKRVIIFNQSGEMVNYFQLIDEFFAFSSIVYDDMSKKIYISLLKKFIVYDTNGKLIQTIQTPDNQTWSFFIENNIIYSGFGTIKLDEATKTGASGSGGEDVYTATVQRSKIARRFKQFINNSYTVSRSANRINFTMSNDAGDKKTIDLSSILPSGYSTDIYKETKNKELIFFAWSSRVKNEKEIMLKFNEKLELISLIEDAEIRDTYGYHIPEQMYITDLGTIYTLSVNSKGAKIIRWTMK